MRPHTTLRQNPKSSYFLKGLHDFNVHSLCQPQIGEVDVFDSDVDENLSDHDDSEDHDFREWQADGSEEFESFSLDEKDDLEPKNESLDDNDLENDTQLCITLGHGGISDDVGKNLLIVNKMAKEEGKAKEAQKKEKQTSIPLQLSTIQLSDTKRCRKCKQLCHNSLTCGQQRDENGRLKYKKKP
ncbi:hypothetical protein Cgig2_008401 [Carnegiea gigantea]|uniref:Uncharacterized protein n=1 Tax=Carnegiea gigantea TaxID=171969 RepID=A0A9Q1KFK0_9CARY|nr:hypothetical protein Cgig2_008401 [Carnegiea gigantea]